MKSIRNSAKAVIINDNKILLTKNEDHLGVFYLFPGGGQEHGEELKDAVKRECVEEIGQEVVVNDLIHIREYIGKNHEFAEWDSNAHQVEFYFTCDLVPSKDFSNATNPDDNQIGVEWIDIKRLNEIRLYPKKLGEMLLENQNKPIYLGDIN